MECFGFAMSVLPDVPELARDLCAEAIHDARRSKKRAAVTTTSPDMEERRCCSSRKTTRDASPRSRVPEPEPEPEQEPPITVPSSGSPVFTCDSPPPPPPPAASSGAAKRAVTFSHTTSVRTIPSVGGHGALAEPDSEAWLKEFDGPRPISTMMDALLHGFFEQGGNGSLESLQFVLGVEHCREMGAAAAELSGRCWQLASRLDSLDAGARVGVLPSCTQVASQHARGVKQLATWLWSSEIDHFPGVGRLNTNSPTARDRVDKINP